MLVNLSEMGEVSLPDGCQARTARCQISPPPTSRHIPAALRMSAQSVSSSFLLHLPSQASHRPLAVTCPSLWTKQHKLSSMLAHSPTPSFQKP